MSINIKKQPQSILALCSLSLAFTAWAEDPPGCPAIWPIPIASLADLAKIGQEKVFVASWNCGLDPSDPRGEPTSAVIAELYHVRYNNEYVIGELTIRGEGAMTNYNLPPEPLPAPTAPWADQSIVKVIIEEGVTTVGNRAFTGLTELESVTIPNSAEKIGTEAFARSTLANVTLGNSVTAIDMEAFYGTRLQSVVIPNSVRTIGAGAFMDCVRLETVTMGGNVTDIGAEAFANTGLTAIEFPNIADRWVTIGDRAFADNNNIVTLEIPNSVITVGAGAFADNTALTTVTIGENVSDIPPSMFENCHNLTSVTMIGGTLRTIGGKAFFGCKRLAAVTIPVSVEAIADSAFFGCERLESVISLREMPPWLVSTETFGGLPGDACLYVPEASIGAYESGGWGGSFDCIRGVSEYVSVSYRPVSVRLGVSSAARVTIRNRTLQMRGLSSESVSRVRLIDMRGKSVASFTARGSANFSLANIPAGRYFVEVRNGARRDRVSVTHCRR